MSEITDKIVSEIQGFTEAEKLRLVDAILNDLDKPDPEIDAVWVEEARKRWAVYKGGRIASVSYEEVMTKHHQS